MGFQVAFSSKRAQLPVLTLITAGENQTILCGVSTIFLEAVVDNPANIPGNTLLWEQLEGVPVTLSSPNTLATNYPFTETSDKLFRFWINKGTPVEQFKDVRVYHTPTSLTGFSKKTDQKAYAPGPNPLPVECSSITGTVTTIPGIPSVPDGEDPAVNVIVLVEWQHPGSHDDFLLQYRIFENGLEVGKIPPTLPSNIGDPLGPPTTLEYQGGLEQYSIESYYNIRGVDYTAESCDVDFSTLDVPDNLVYNSTNTFSSNNQSSIFKTNFTFNINSQQDQTAFSNNTQYSSDIIKFDFEVQNGEDDLSFSTSATNRISSINRIDQQGIGS
jgi:hypothetical protein